MQHKDAIAGLIGHVQINNNEVEELQEHPSTDCDALMVDMIPETLESAEKAKQWNLTLTTCQALEWHHSDEPQHSPLFRTLPRIKTGCIPMPQTSADIPEQQQHIPAHNLSQGQDQAAGDDIHGQTQDMCAGMQLVTQGMLACLQIQDTAPCLPLSTSQGIHAAVQLEEAPTRLATALQTNPTGRLPAPGGDT